MRNVFLVHPWQRPFVGITHALFALFVAIIFSEPVCAKSSAATTNTVQWIHIDKGDTSAAFARAKAENKPVLLFWTAVWCPPCNQVKSTVFARADFVETSKSFIPLYVDGDAAGAQRLGAQLGVRGYPTTIVFAPDGREITRLPGEVEPARYMRLLSLGLKATRPVKQLMAAALSGETLSLEDWDLLTYYSWDTDQDKLVAENERATTLQKIAQRAATPYPKIAARLQLKALSYAASKAAKDKSPIAATEQSLAHAQLTRMLADPTSSQENFDVLSGSAGDLLRYATAKDSPKRATMLAAYNSMLDRTVNSEKSTHGERLDGLVGKISLAKLDSPEIQAASESKSASLSPALLAQVRAVTKAADTQTADRITRQAIMSTAAYALTEAGLIDESDALLKIEVTKAISPHYFYSDLSSNAKKRGDKAAAVTYAAQAFEKAQGAATRLQWGSSYVRTIITETPQETARIVSATKSVLNEVGDAPDAFYERNRRSLERIGSALDAWANTDARKTALIGLRADLDRVCQKLPANDPAVNVCRSVFKPNSHKAS
jgi:thioredoxin-related protein